MHSHAASVCWYTFAAHEILYLALELIATVNELTIGLIRSGVCTRTPRDVHKYAEQGFDHSHALSLKTLHSPAVECAGQAWKSCGGL